MATEQPPADDSSTETNQGVEKVEISDRHVFDAGEGHYTVFHPGTHEVFYVHINPSWQDWPIQTPSGEIVKSGAGMDALRAVMDIAPARKSALELEYEHLRRLEQRLMNAVSASNGNPTGATTTGGQASSGGSAGGSSGSGGSDSGEEDGDDDSPINKLSEGQAKEHYEDIDGLRDRAAEFFDRWAGVKKDLKPDWIEVTFAEAAVPESWDSPHAGTTVAGVVLEHAAPWETGAWDSSGNGGGSWASSAKESEFKDSQQAFRDVMQDPEEVIYFGDPEYVNVLPFADVDEVL